MEEITKLIMKIHDAQGCINTWKEDKDYALLKRGVLICQFLNLNKILFKIIFSNM
jgi:hypothetical protein